MGCEKDSDYYNEMFKKGYQYREHYKTSPYLTIYNVAKGMLTEIPNPQILELGCGSGQFAHMLWDSGYLCYSGVDFSETALGIAQGLSPQVFEWADILEYEPNWDNFNVVVMLEVLEHITNDLELVKKIPSGKHIIFSLPSFDDPSHVRKFNTTEQVMDRYDKLIHITEMVPYLHWIIAKGVRRG
jgi:2-polyprenyl-3-methyl-5-hydroxy-6-metoxy-1,4-benzoquinol methylase